MTSQATAPPRLSARLSVLAGAGLFLLFGFIAFRQISAGLVYVDIFPADTLFVFDIILRIAAGDVPHVDFTLHLGALPYVLAALTGASTPGAAFLIAQTAFTGTCLIIGLWVWRTRLGPVTGPILLVFVLILGQTLSLPRSTEMSLGLFYNRWSWALALLFACQTLLSPTSGSRRADGALTGLLAFALLTTKITFFVGLLPAALICTVMRRRWTEIAVGLAVFTGLALATHLAAPGFWAGYVENMAWAAGNPLRPDAGTDLASLVGGAAFLGYTLVFAVFLGAVQRTQGTGEAIWLTIAAVGFYFIQYQNYLSTPYWVLFLAIYSIRQVQMVGGRDKLRFVWAVLSLAFLVFSIALLLPMTNGLRASQPGPGENGYVALPDIGGVATGAAFLEPMVRPIETQTFAITEASSPWAGDEECVITSGWGQLHMELARVVGALPGPAFIADSISPHWYLSGAEPLRGVAVWNYGSLRGLDAAAFVVVPVCAQKPDYKRVILVEMDAAGVVLEPYSEREWASVYRVSR